MEFSWAKEPKAEEVGLTSLDNIFLLPDVALLPR
jgi:hypothetical protein